jgi:hypothetical protein
MSKHYDIDVQEKCYPPEFHPENLDIGELAIITVVPNGQAGLVVGDIIVKARDTFLFPRTNQYGALGSTWRVRRLMRDETVTFKGK